MFPCEIFSLILYSFYDCPDFFPFFFWFLILIFTCLVVFLHYVVELGSYKLDLIETSSLILKSVTSVCNN